ncbi:MULTISPECIES: glycerophosphodiester phosphodiesterase family protein [Microbacterium]|uniref:glycerophosphodiester phosphodiesterase family protein n=1 Tax=Microbacterium TaxID=33882 RepID=UPI002787811E|nr:MULTISPECIES: glycerophosphodiester phosphodiesterase family protein [Microbacterium]MDQ1083057.1 glycerophosphoryl diester phosphodiesterase [Microbacterium sp. SORGH_AS_0344]MDQ1171671.1 glycerophosphoryl diester phosphodiesterase [Microbacterium proteolyticum]
MPLVIGHRGAPGSLPEHSRSSYERAISAGVDAVEPDVVPSRDGVLVVRHENEIAATTDISMKAEFAERRTTKLVEGEWVTGWFTEDFTWEELRTLRCRERLPALRRESATHDDTEPILRLRDVLDLARASGVGVILEIKHAASFARLGFDMAALVAAELREAGWTNAAELLIIESFEPGVLARLRERGIRVPLVQLVEAAGAPWDLREHDGAEAATYASMLTPAGLDALAAEVEGISVDKELLLAPDRAAPLVAAAHERGLRVFAWTCRPENAFLLPAHRLPGGDGAFGDWPREWALLRAAELDGVFVDHPDLGVEFFRD